MTIMHEPLRKLITEPLHLLLQEQLKLAGQDPQLMSIIDVYKALVEPPNPDMGHLAFGCFIAAKHLKKAPPQVGQVLVQQLTEWLKQQPSYAQQIESVIAAGPYINVKFTSIGLFQHTVLPVLNDSVFQTKLTENTPKMMIEYSQPNTHKELHVGHMRNMCLGDALIRMLRYSGYNILASTFPGDVGTHVAKCLWYLKFHNTEPIPAVNKGEWLGAMYSKGNLKLEDEENTPKYEENKKILTEILKQLESKNGERSDPCLILLSHSIQTFAF